LELGATRGLFVDAGGYGQGSRVIIILNFYLGGNSNITIISDSGATLRTTTIYLLYEENVSDKN
jgi:hypothetical protein